MSVTNVMLQVCNLVLRDPTVSKNQLFSWHHRKGFTKEGTSSCIWKDE